MSAQAVLSMIAPTASAPLRGASTAADPGFDSLLADVVESGIDLGDAPEEPSARAEDAVAVDATQTNLFSAPLPVIMAPAPPVVPAVVPVEAGADTTPAPSAAAPDVGEPSPVNPLAVVDAPDRTAPPTTGLAVTTPAAADAEAGTPEAKAATQTNATQASTVATQAPAPQTAAAVLPAPAPAPSPSPSPSPSPALRPLAERTSKPIEAGNSSSEAAEPRSSVSSPASTSPRVQPDGDARPSEPTVRAGTEASVAPLTDDAAGPEGQAADEGSIAQTQTPAATRELALSSLSRVTIDATAQIAAQIQRKLEGRSTRFEMALHPEDLGRVDVKLDIDAEGRLAARLAFDNPAAAADLRGRADELRRQLQDAGFHVPDDAFEFTERDSGSSAFDRGTSNQNNSGRQNRAFAAASRLNAEIDVAQPPRWMSLSLSPAGVDLKV